MRRWFLVVALVFLFSGCSTVTYRTSPKFDNYFEEKKKVAVLSPDMKIYRKTAGGVDQYQDDWTIVSKKFMQEELEKEIETFQKIDFSLINYEELSDTDKDFIDAQKAIFYTVAISIHAHTYAEATTFQHKKKDFDYTLGDEISEIKRLTDADAILFVNGRNYIWTAGRSSLAFLSAMVGLATGIYIQVPAGPEWLVASLVDTTSGDVLWFNLFVTPGDMRKHKTDRRLIKKLFRDFPEEWRDVEKWTLRKEEPEIEGN